MLNLPENVKSIHFYSENISFPVFIYTCSEWERVQVSFLNQIYDNAGFTTLGLCQWCENHHIKFQILYPHNIFKLLFKDPLRFLCYIYIKNKGY